MQHAKPSLLILFLFALNSCRLSIGTNEHSMLNATALDHFKPYPLEIANFKGNDTTNLLIYEINTPDLKQEIKKNHYIWVHLWRPYCTSDACENINAPLKSAAKYNIAYFLVATSYDLKSIKESVVRTGYKAPICVLQNSYFHKAERFNGKSKSLAQLSKELNNNPTLKGKYVDDYFFKDTLLIYTGSPSSNSLLNGHILDSLMLIYK
jgi:hypothetical protein